MFFKGSKIAICPKCGKNFASEQALYYHLIIKKTKCSELKCTICNKISKNKIEHNIHINLCKEIHENIHFYLDHIKNKFETKLLNNSIANNDKWIELHKIKGQVSNFPNSQKILALIENFRPCNNNEYSNENINNLFKNIEYYSVQVC